VTTCESVLVMLISPTNLKVIAVISAVLSAIVDLMFLRPIVTVVVIVLYSEVFSTYILM
jgi:hypothetical protein